jgi:hypothetical protein
MLESFRIVYENRESQNGSVTESYIKRLTTKIANNYIQIAIALLIVIGGIGVRKYVNVDVFSNFKSNIGSFVRSIILLKN